MRDNLIPVIERDVLKERVRSILYCGESGAASIVGIAKRLASAGRQFEVHHFARAADHAMFVDEFDALREHGKIYHHLDLTDDLFAQESAFTMSPTRACTQIYCSGPPAFTDLVERQAREWVHASNIHKIVLNDLAARN
ncbi:MULTISPECIES: oxidoreductase FAD/NAD(P)-binding domain-containing protein [Caballeronia]|jgi:ferredoxin-NADP reductase|uniref:Oxidoreductase n=1 Tax=Caballeronia zhejiangensis TaxID=871203 RepID=A0A656Q8V4_9BURK|nr:MULTISPECIES: oxidoreductase FAD/NAD(P)-binding domain-containing protein [Caballeronia]EKS70532.1 oxidoreductase FAD/NAD(P)-binding domain-containing protein [Burkholderia sp. SJ98]KDR24737.1 oxidoreductase [Caballeronia zhejiangensis]MCG7401790.1 hypothetical protein [Caballeronia zhejiangensis]MCI1046034.1 hypothetical protein [Caballeronia zhejiangensis]MDR5791054.1 hypothetical protein [Caballeronia sp. LP003]